MKYLERITKTEEDRAKEDNIFLNEEKLNNCNVEILQAKRDVSKLKREVEEARSSADLSLDKIIAIRLNLIVAERTLKMYEEELKELF